MEQEEKSPFFAASTSVRSDRILYTPSSFAKSNLLYLQEIGKLTALAPHTSQRGELSSCLCFLVLSGSGRLAYEGREYPLQTGDVVFLNCRTPYSHSTAREDLWSLQWCHFYGASVQSIYTKYCERGGGPVIHPENLQPYVQLLTELYELAGSDDYIRDMRINEKLGSLLTCLMSESWHPEKSLKEHAKKLDVKQVKAYLDEHYADKLTLETVANHFFINKHYLARLFKEQYGVTLVSYLQMVRITHAKQMLRFTDKKIEEIGFACGVGEPAYFSRIFKKVEGISPSEYRDLW